MRINERVLRGGLFALALLAASVLGSFFSKQVIHNDPGLAAIDQPLEIKELIVRVRKELAAQEIEMRGREDLALFRLKEFEMEINYVVRAGSVLKTEVVDVGTDLSVDREKVQKLILRWDVCAERKRGTVAASRNISGAASGNAGTSETIVIGPERATVVAPDSAVGSSTGGPIHDDCH